MHRIQQISHRPCVSDLYHRATRSRCVPSCLQSSRHEGPEAVKTTDCTTHLILSFNPRRRFFSTKAGGDQLSVAVVGGGVAGLSTALHLAPLVEAGYLSAPIDVYDAPQLRPVDRDIGVGIWSTALHPFLATGGRESHMLVYDEMTRQGTWLGDVGYRSPSGTWILKSHLPTDDAEIREEATKNHMPSLLFLREKDMIRSLKKAAHLESLKGTIQVHSDGDKTKVCALQEDSPLPWSAKVAFEQGRMSDRDYHLIIAADGTHSVLRQVYGGHSSFVSGSSGQRSTGTGISGMSSSLPSPNNLPLDNSKQQHQAWNTSKHQEAVGLQYRGYTVFRGNSRLTTEQLGGDASNPMSFQTWGVRNSMRFATVPMLYPVGGSKKEERQVWFITVDDKHIADEPDPSKRRDFLLNTFKDWHDPICRIVEATPPEEILFERAIAHRHSMGPVLNLNRILEQMRGKRPPSSSGDGPCLVFVGDAYMTVDPILAQGFTMAMEGAAALRQSVEAACSGSVGDASSPGSGAVGSSTSNDWGLAFDPYQLRRELKDRQEARIDRLICLLRATELVQALGQPSGGTLSGFLNTKLLRPVTLVAPNIIKQPVFDAVMKYSLGLLGKK